MEDGDRFVFKTQAGKKYKQAKCEVLYTLGDSCSKMKIDCSKKSFSFAGKKKCNKRSKDKLTIVAKKSKS